MVQRFGRGLFNPASLPPPVAFAFSIDPRNRVGIFKDPGLAETWKSTAWDVLKHYAAKEFDKRHSAESPVRADLAEADQDWYVTLLSAMLLYFHVSILL